MITLVLGGARSGKSEVAETLAAKAGEPVTYIATYAAAGTAVAEDPADPDMAERIAAHRARRPPGWTTVECGSDLAAALRTTGGTVLVDSLGTWVAATSDMAVDVGELVEVLVRRDGDTVLVSEEVGMGVHPASEAGRRFRDVVGAVNRAVAGMADDVLLVVAGRVLPLEAP